MRRVIFLLLLYHYLIYSRKNPLLMRITTIEHTFNRMLWCNTSDTVCATKYVVKQRTPETMTDKKKSGGKKSTVTVFSVYYHETLISRTIGDCLFFVDCRSIFFVVSLLTFVQKPRHRQQQQQHQRNNRITCKNGE